MVILRSNSADKAKEVDMIENLITKSMNRNFLGLFDEEGNVKVDDVQDFMELSRNQLAEIFGLTGDQLRSDRIAPKTSQRISELAGALEFVAESFAGDTKKTKFWMKTPNLNFGGSSPHELILRGKHKKVIQFILAAKAS